MNKISSFYGLFLCLSFSTCHKKDDRTLDYSALAFDTSHTSIFKWDSTVVYFPRFSEPLTLNNSDIDIVDSLMKDAITKFNNTNSERFYKSFNGQFPIDSFVIHLVKYKRQLFPYRDNNGKRIIYVIAFSWTFHSWHNSAYYRRIGSGFSEFGLRINLSDTTASGLSIGSFG